VRYLDRTGFLPRSPSVAIVLGRINGGISHATNPTMPRSARNSMRCKNNGVRTVNATFLVSLVRPTSNTSTSAPDSPR
jgi:hypothetical protein